MRNDNILAERHFTITHQGRNYDIKARAIFMTHVLQHEEVGKYYLDFISRGEPVSNFPPDQNLYSREQARKVAESLFDSGQVEAYARSEIEDWINTSGVY
jgi:hypothetical protein